ncbi:hypothetical protein ACFOTD_19300 [Cohnella sp. GCM10012308]
MGAKKRWIELLGEETSALRAKKLWIELLWHDPAGCEPRETGSIYWTGMMERANRIGAAAA